MSAQQREATLNSVRASSVDSSCVYLMGPAVHDRKQPELHGSVHGSIESG